MSDTTTPQTKEKVGIGAYVSLIFACVFFSGVLAGNHWWSVFDFTSLNGGFGKVVASVSQSADGVTAAFSNFRGKGGSGAVDGFVFALTLVPTVMFALAMITALTRQLKDAGELNEAEVNIFCQFQYSADATITNFLSSGAVLFTLTAADGKLAVPTSIGVCLGLILVMKFVIANVMRLLMIRSAKKAAK